MTVIVRSRRIDAERYWMRADRALSRQACTGSRNTIGTVPIAAVGTPSTSGG